MYGEYLLLFIPHDQPLQVMNVDCGIDMAKDTRVPATMPMIIRASVDGVPRQTFLPSDTSLLASPQARLNDTCINSCATLLYSASMPAAMCCAILSTHDLPHTRCHADDDLLWQNTSWTHFWEKPIWIIPIHRPLPMGHWVLCTIDFPSRKLLLFDSLAEQKAWKNEIKVSRHCKPIIIYEFVVQDIMWLICRLSSIATQKLGTNQQDRGDWMAHPVLVGFQDLRTHVLLIY